MISHITTSNKASVQLSRPHLIQHTGSHRGALKVFNIHNQVTWAYLEVSVVSMCFIIFGHQAALLNPSISNMVQSPKVPREVQVRRTTSNMALTLTLDKRHLTTKKPFQKWIMLSEVERYCDLGLTAPPFSLNTFPSVLSREHGYPTPKNKHNKHESNFKQSNMKY